MFRNKLTALEHPSPNIDCSNPSQFASTILWLEDQKIRHYKIEDRAGLRNINDKTVWDAAYQQYKNDLNCPSDLSGPEAELSWFLNYAVRVEYLDNADTYKEYTAEKIVASRKPVCPVVASKNPFDVMDMSTSDFQAGIHKLAQRLNIPHHPDHLIMLEAISKVIHNRLTDDALKEPPPTGKPYSVTDNPKFIYDNKDMDQAAEILRLLQMQSTRQLQTSINESIVAVQALTANPKTDTKLGKVGF